MHVTRLIALVVNKALGHGPVIMSSVLHSAAAKMPVPSCMYLNEKLALARNGQEKSLLLTIPRPTLNFGGSLLRWWYNHCSIKYSTLAGSSRLLKQALMHVYTKVHALDDLPEDS